MAVTDAPPRRPAGGSTPGSGGRPGDAPGTLQRAIPRRDPRPRWGTSGILLAALLIAFWGLHPLLEELSWWVFPALFAALVLGSAAIVRAVLASRWLPTAVAAIVAVMAFTLTYGNPTGLLLVIPTPTTATRVGELIDSGVESIREQGVPAEPTLGIVFLIAVLASVCALFADLVAISLARPALAAIPLLAPLMVTVTIRDSSSDAFVWIGVAALYFVLLRIGARPAPRATTIATGVAVIVGSLLAPILLPPVTQSDANIGGGFGIRVNPFIDLGRDLRANNPVLALEYNTDSSLPVYLRLATLQNFSGRQWAPNPVDPAAGNTVDSIAPPPGVAADVERSEQSVDVRIQSIGGRWLPTPYPTTSVEGLDGAWFWEPQGLTVRSSSSGVDGQDYRANFLDIEPTRTQLEAAGNDVPPGYERYLAVPGLDPVITETAQQVAGGGVTQYDRAVLLQEWFRSEFTYSEQAPVDEGYDGTGLGVLPEFLTAKSGYCVHFSSAMAVMARVLGIPARIAVGFQPGTPAGNQATGPSQYRVTTRDLHAWPELYFTGVGWTRFEPTPSRGSVPGYSLPAPVDDPNTPDVDESIEVPVETPSPEVTGAPERPDVDLGDTPTDATGAQGVPAGIIALAIVLGVLLLLLIPFGARRVKRAVRLSRVARHDGAASAAWSEVRDTARDHGWRAPPTETVREFADRLELVLIDRAGAVVRLRNAIESEVYSPTHGAAVSADDVRSVVTGLSRSVDWRERVRAALLPPSLIERWVPSAAPDDAYVR